jgi:hypothetical protein
MVGVPAKHVGWMTRFGERLPIDFESYTCKNLAETYSLKQNKIYVQKKDIAT